jgi:hypothetical protein
MDKIEQQVRLPQGASPLARYARYYAVRADGKIRGNYLPPEESTSSDQSCVEVSSNSQSRDLPCPTPAAAAKAGERRWLQSEERLPWIMDAGCGAVSVIFDPRTNKIERISCSDPSMVPLPPQIATGR